MYMDPPRTTHAGDREQLDMAVPDSWPQGIRTKDDAFKFARLLCGPSSDIRDYADRLPHESSKSFLLFVKGGCKDGTPFFGIKKLIQPMMEEIVEYEKKECNNCQNPEASHQMLSRYGDVIHYHSCQLTKSPCKCRVLFGADSHHRKIPTDSKYWTAGNKFANLWHKTLEKNLSSMQITWADMEQPVWLQKTWHTVWNYMDHKKGHGIVYHSDLSNTYDARDPIASFSFGHGGVLALKSTRPKRKNKAAVHSVLFQEEGDVLIMAGDFQTEFQHAVPPRKSWQELRGLEFPGGLQEWEQAGLETELRLHNQDEEDENYKPHVRLNCTVRWHHKHLKDRNCPCYNKTHEISFSQIKRYNDDSGSNASSLKTPRSW